MFKVTRLKTIWYIWHNFNLKPQNLESSLSSYTACQVKLCHFFWNRGVIIKGYQVAKPHYEGLGENGANKGEDTGVHFEESIWIHIREFEAIHLMGRKTGGEIYERKWDLHMMFIWPWKGLWVMTVHRNVLGR